MASALAALAAYEDEDVDDDNTGAEAAQSAGPPLEARAIMPAVHAAPDVDIAFEVRAPRELCARCVSCARGGAARRPIG